MSEDPKPTPVKPRKPRKSDIPFSFLPHGNRPAAVSYVAAMAGLVPGLGVLAGPVAVVSGYWGRRRALRLETRSGIGHAFAGLVFGSFETVSHGAGLYLLFS